MELFRTLFTSFMLALPGIASLFVRPRPGAEDDRPRIRRLRAALWLATAASFALFFALKAARRNGWLEWWRDIPAWMTWSRFPDQLCWLLFFPLWFLFFMRLLAAARPAAIGPYPTAAGRALPRSATLAPRTLRRPIRARHWACAWSVYALAAGAVGLRLILGPSREAGAAAHPLAAVALLAFGAMPFACAPFAVRAAMREPEPLDPAGSPELRAAYERVREAKVWGFFWMLWSMTVMFSGFAVAVAWIERGSAVLGWVGGFGGSAIGIAGAAFGVRIGILRTRIREQLDDLVAAQSQRASADPG